MKQELLEHKDSVSSLQSLGKRVIPLEHRRIPLREPKVAVSVCDYKQATVRSDFFMTMFPETSSSFESLAYGRNLCLCSNKHTTALEVLNQLRLTAIFSLNA